ncbi:MAG: CCA tRNA nucleotidyltransferase [Christensenellaceae bacterium]|nr:CCA tRNA nucleotidyltransferase [Christensenellaceae bacterium]
MIKVSDELSLFARCVEAAGARLYAVGGLVRNGLLGLPVYDIDVCSALRPEAVISLCARAGFGIVRKGIDFGMVEVHINGKKFEHTTFRSDSYAEGGAHRPSAVRFSTTVEEDAFRRDFTVNALYLDVLSGQIKDPTGGLTDLEKRIIRTTSPSPYTVLSDDGLRIMRMVRFAAELYFDIDAETYETAKQLCGNLKDISPERIRDELNKILLSDVKYGERNPERVLHGLELLRDVGAIELILPELYLGRGIEQKPTHHLYDVLDHCLHTAAEISPNLVMRLSGLLHDVGKPPVNLRTGKMYGHDLEGADISREILTRLRYDNKTIAEVCFIVRHHMYDLNNTAKESTLRTTFGRWGYERSMEIAEIREADVHGSGIIKGEVKSADRWRELLKKMKDEHTPFSDKELNCTGEDIMRWLSLPPGPRVGDIKRRLLEHCARFPQDNTPEKLERLARDVSGAFIGTPPRTPLGAF